MMTLNHDDSEQETLPSELLSRATILAGEPAWPSVDVLLVIDWLVRKGYVTLGVELWREKDGSPLWIASSDYNHDQEVNWSKRVHLCAESAKDFVRRFEREPGALFNLLWIREGKQYGPFQDSDGQS
jgi:hypothetical protein